MKYRIERGDGGEWIMAEVWKRGSAVLMDGLLNKGTAFTDAERETFDLVGMLPPQPTDRWRQQARAYEHVTEKGDHPLEKYVALAALQDRNESLFYQVLAEHTEELTPIVYTPTVGEAATRFSHLFRRGRGLWITPKHRGRIFDVLGHARNEEVRLIVVTDNERILGLGDQGAGGMVIPIGKLALYTLGAGIHPAYTLPISLDVGTDNETLLADDLYVGWPHRRLRGEAYYEFVDEFIDAVTRRFPGALLQWEDFKKANAFTLLDRYRSVLPSFNDDIQGTAAVVVSGILAACRATGTKLADQRILLVGAGAAGVGIGRHVRHALAVDGVIGEPLREAIAMYDTKGFVIGDRSDLDAHKQDLAWPAGVAGSHGIDADSSLADVIAAMQPTVLIGTTGTAGAFGEDVIRAMAGHTDRPLVMALSNPTSKTEVQPEDAIEWTEGRAIVATGSPFAPVRYHDRVIPVSQCNNVYIFPGVGLGAIVAKASQVTDSMFAAAAGALAGTVSQGDVDRGVLFPPIAELRKVSLVIAKAVAREARDCGTGLELSDDQIEQAVEHEAWDLEYPILRPA
jgi:malic enzyme